MAGKLITMSKVKQILQFIEQGVSQREISRCLQIDRKTVSHYFSKSKELSLTKKILQTISDQELEAFVNGNFEWFFVNFGGNYPKLDRTTFLLNNSNPALPYICLFIFLSLFTHPSVNPLL